MKNIITQRAFKTVLYLFISMAVFAGCGNKKQKHTSQIKTGLYSNLLDKKGQEEVKEAMLKAGISLENISSFLQNVEQFNEAIEGEGLVTVLIPIK